MTEAGRSRATPGGSSVPDRLRRPLHFGVLLGMSTGLYATTLTATAILQQRADDDLAAARSPAVATAHKLRAANDGLAGAVDTLNRRQAALARSYGSLRASVDDAESALGDLASLVGEVSGEAAALPRRIALPAVPSASVRIATKSSRAHATTGGSGTP